MTIACGSTTTGPTPLADQSGCNFTVSTTTFNVDSASGSNQVNVTASASGCSWTALSNTSFIVASPASGIGSGTVALAYSQNTAAARTGTVTVAGHTVTVNQGASTAPTPLAGTWRGTWMWTGTGVDGCTYSNGGTLSMTLTQTGSSFSGSTSAAGVQLRDANNGCALTSTITSPGTIFGTMSGTDVTLTFFVSGTDPGSQLDGTATLSGTTLTATFPREGSESAMGSGSFTVTRQ
jgi:hypothetical protein